MLVLLLSTISSWQAEPGLVPSPSQEALVTESKLRGSWHFSITDIRQSLEPHWLPPGFPSHLCLCIQGLPQARNFSVKLLHYAKQRQGIHPAKLDRWRLIHIMQNKPGNLYTLRTFKHAFMLLRFQIAASWTLQFIQMINDNFIVA